MGSYGVILIILAIGLNIFPVANNLKEGLNYDESLHYSCHSSSILKKCEPYEVFRCVHIHGKDQLNDQCLYIYEKVFSSYNNKYSDDVIKVGQYYLSSMMTRDSLADNMTLKSIESLYKCNHMTGRTKRQNTKVTKESEVAIPIGFWISLANHFQVKELVFVIDIVDFIGKGSIFKYFVKPFTQEY